jgi:hypothetical protein
MPDILKSISAYSSNLNPTAIFTDKTINEIKSSQYACRIYINGKDDVGLKSIGMIEGIVTEPPEISVAAEWNASGMLDMITSNFGLLDTVYKYTSAVMGLGGMADMKNLGVSSKKIYTKSGYLEFTLKMRCVDWKGTKVPINACVLLSSLCLPKEISEIGMGEAIGSTTGAVAGAAGSGILGGIGKVMSALVKDGRLSQQQANDILESITKGTMSVGGYLKDGVEGIMSSLGVAGDVAKEAINQTVGDSQFLVVAKSPLPVTIAIGNYFYRKDMIVESVKTTFSKQMTLYGPLYADFDIALSSRKALLLNTKNDVDGLGIVTDSSTSSRVDIEL